VPQNSSQIERPRRATTEVRIAMVHRFHRCTFDGKPTPPPRPAPRFLQTLSHAASLNSLYSRSTWNFKPPLSHMQRRTRHKSAMTVAIKPITAATLFAKKDPKAGKAEKTRTRTSERCTSVRRLGPSFSFDSNRTEFTRSLRPSWEHWPVCREFAATTAKTQIIGASSSNPVKICTIFIIAL